MGDSWAICPRCKVFDMDFERLPNNRTDGVVMVRCKDCGSIMPEIGIPRKTIEYGVDRDERRDFKCSCED